MAVNGRRCALDVLVQVIDVLVLILFAIALFGCAPHRYHHAKLDVSGETHPLIRLRWPDGKIHDACDMADVLLDSQTGVYIIVCK